MKDVSGADDNRPGDEAGDGVEITLHPVDGSPSTRWPLWTAAAIAGVAAVIMVVTLVGWLRADTAADEDEARARAGQAESGEVDDDLAAAEAATAEKANEAEVLRDLLRPGIAGELQGVYLLVAQTACRHPDQDVEDLIDRVADRVSADSDLLAATPGWEAALDRQSVSEALAACGSDDA